MKSILQKIKYWNKIKLIGNPGYRIINFPEITTNL